MVAEDAFGIAADAVPAVVLATEPGDVVVFYQNIFHASCHGGARRRMFTINLAEGYPPERLGDLRGALAGQARFLSEQWILEPMRRVATPRMHRHLDPVIAQEHVLAEAVRAKRARRQEAARG